MYGARQTASGVSVPMQQQQRSADHNPLGANWVRETVNWSEDKRKRGYKPSSLATGNQASSPSTGALPSPLSSVASPTSSRYSRAAAPGTLASAPADGSPGSAFGRRPLRTAPSAPAAAPASQQQQQPHEARAPIQSPQSAPARAGRVRRREDPEEKRMRGEMDALMSEVLALQDSGRFADVPPLMHRIDTLQRQLEDRWKQEHVAATGAAPPLAPMPDILTPMLSGTSNNNDAAAPAAPEPGAQPQPMPRRARKPGHKPATASLGQKIGGLVSGGELSERQQVGEMDAEDSSSDEEKLDAQSNSSSSAGGSSGRAAAAAPASSASSARAAPAAPPEPAPSLPGGRRRRGSLSRQVSDHLLLVSGEREQEIIHTLHNKSERAPAAKARGGRGVFGARNTGASTRAMAAAPGQGLPGDGDGAATAPPGPRPVFSRWASTRAAGASARNLTAAQRQGSSAARERTMLTVEGWMHKAPPQHKLFSRWRYRYFVLAGPLLSYKKGAHTSRIIPLKGAKAELVILDRSKLSSKGRYEIRLQCANAARVYRLRQRTRKTAVEWLVAIQNNIKVAAEQGDATLFERRRRDKQFRKSAGQDANWVPPERDRTGEVLAMHPGDEGAEDANGFYRVLGLAPSASAGVIKKRYRELAREYHPDKNKAGEDVSRFAEIARAYETLQEPELRRSYDLCERVKLLLRQGVFFTLHEGEQRPRPIVMLVDDEFKILFWQDAEQGGVLQPGYQYAHMRFVQEILAGTDGFACPPGKADCCLTLRGVLLGCSLGVREKRATNICLQMQSKQARDDMLEGLRILRCRFSELFKQRLDEMKEEGMR